MTYFGKTEILPPMKDFLKALGGAASVAEQLSAMANAPLKANAVYQWPYEGTIPHRWRLHVARLAAERSIPIPDELSFLQPFALEVCPPPQPLTSTEGLSLSKNASLNGNVAKSDAA